MSIVLTERFWSKVDKTEGCWNWTAGTNGVGYGLFRPGGTVPRKLAHRLSYEEAKGPIPEGAFIMHLCNNPLCVRPDHLQAGTQHDNMRHCSRSGRLRIPHRRGEENIQAKHTEAQIRQVIALIKEGLGQRDIVRLTGASLHTVKDVRRGRAWRHLQADGGGHL